MDGLEGTRVDPRLVVGSNGGLVGGAPARSSGVPQCALHKVETVQARDS